jgi:ubiquitin-protein ligase
LEFYWKRTPPGFHDVVDENRLCTEQLLYDEEWTPDITVETIFEALDTHKYFAGKKS